MIILRELLYEEKPLSAWDIDTEGTLYYELFEQILKTDGFRTSGTNTEELVTSLFNDASFLCTLTYDYFERPYMHIQDFKVHVTPPLHIGIGLTQWERDMDTKSLHYANIVLIVTYFILIHSVGNRTTKDTKIRRTIDELDSHLRDSSTYSHDAFQSFREAITEFSPELDIPAEAFHRRELTKELITSVDWNQTTNGYNTEQITNIVKTIGRDDKERLWLIDAIENEVMEAKASDPEAALGEFPFESMKVEKYKKIFEFLEQLRSEINIDAIPKTEEKEKTPSPEIVAKLNEDPDFTNKMAVVSRKDLERLQEIERQYDAIKQGLKESKEKSAKESEELEELESKELLTITVGDKSYSIKATKKNRVYLLGILGQQLNSSVNVDNKKILNFIIGNSLNSKYIDTTIRKANKEGTGEGHLSHDEKEFFQKLKEKYNLSR